MLFLAGIVNVPASDNDWYLTRLTKSLTQSHVISNHYKSLQRFQRRIVFQFDEIDAMKITYFLEIHFS